MVVNSFPGFTGTQTTPQIPNSKYQNPNKLQIPSSNVGRQQLGKRGLGFGVWDLFGFWILDFGISHDASRLSAGCKMASITCAAESSCTRAITEN
jgi:hypothetical protein